MSDRFVNTLRQELPGFEVVAPDIPVDPVEALPFLKDLCKKENPNVVIGTSMGGMYAQQMSGFNRIFSQIFVVPLPCL